MKQELILLVFLFCSLVSFEQQNVFSIENGIESTLARKINQTSLHTAIQPYNYNALLQEEMQIDSLVTHSKLDESKLAYWKREKKYFVSSIGGGRFGLNTVSGKANYQASIGALVQYAPSAKLGVQVSYRYIVTELPTYIDTSIFAKNVIPSVGRLELIPSQNNGVNDLQGSIAYTPNKFFSFLLGRGNHFWGDGYRSLFLSDNASAYPYFRIESTFWKVKYTNLYAYHSDISSGVAKDKYSASHHLSWNIIEGLNMGLFETVIWAGNDTLINRGFDVNYLNPAIFYRPVEYAQGSNDNSIMGLNFKGVLFKNHIFYAQLVLDEFLLAELRNKSGWWGNKYAIQIGYKNYKLFNNPNLSVLMERNIARPFTYSHIIPTLNYGHFNQSLAHPLGANFKETVFQLAYRKNKWVVKEQANFIAFGADTSAVNYGGDIFKSYADRVGEYGHKILQGNTHRIFYNKVTVSYTLVDAIKLNAFTAVELRNEQTKNTNITDLFIHIGIATQLWNSYRDF